MFSSTEQINEWNGKNKVVLLVLDLLDMGSKVHSICFMQKSDENIASHF